MRALFLDRDGVINRKADRYVTSREAFHFLPHAIEALQFLTASPFVVVVVTNQAAVGRGLMTAHTLDSIHAGMLEQVRAAGGNIDAIYVCPHRPEDGCQCRKPRPGLLYRAARELDLDLAGSYLIGDAVSDIQAGLAVGCQPILVLTGDGSMARTKLDGQCGGRFWIAEDLLHAAKIIVASDARTSTSVDGDVGHRPGVSGALLSAEDVRSWGPWPGTSLGPSQQRNTTPRAR